MLTQLLLALVASASAATIKINVGEAGLTFTPDTTKAEVGDILEFHFVGGVHDTVRGDFDKPCQPAPAEGGWASGSITGSATNVSGPHFLSYSPCSFVRMREAYQIVTMVHVD